MSHRTVRLAVFSDIHGNLPALQAVLAAIDADAPDAIWYAGDFVGYGPWPDECVQRLQGRGLPAIQGNYDEKTLRFPQKAKKWARTKDPRKWAAFRHAYENLSPASRAYLAALPKEHRETMGGRRVLMVHAAPDSEEDGIHPLTPTERLETIARTSGADVIITGHTHLPFIRTVGGTLFVNAGSAGRPGDGDTRAAYALVTLSEDGPAEARVYRVAYPVERVIDALAAAGLPPEFAGLYRTGRATL